MHFVVTLLRMLEVLFIYISGFVLLLQGAKNRFHRTFTLIICTCIYGSYLILNIWIAAAICKFNIYEYLIAFAVSFLLISVFFQTTWMEVFFNCLIYWGYIACYRYIFASIGVVVSREIDMRNYANRIRNCYYSEIIEAVLLCVILSFLLYKKKGQTLLRFERKSRYGIASIVLIAVAMFSIWENFLYKNLLFFNVTGTLGLILFSIFVLMYIYQSEQKKMQVEFERQSEQVMEQYDILRTNYEEKRKIIHDEIQQNGLLLEYLKQDKTQDAIELLELQQADYRKTAVPTVTGLLEMDLLLHHKRQRLAEKEIQLHVEADVYNNPFMVNEWCILFGNLIDNAMEAVEQLPSDQRVIYIKLQNCNDMFFMEISNPYEGVALKSHDRFLTKKADKKNHGIGLESCRYIVKAHNGEMNIESDKQQFCVKVLVYNSIK